MIDKGVKFVKEAYSELTKATWLNRTQVIQSTIFVFIIVLLISAYINLVDFGLSKLLRVILGGR
jgi:preprotein translocase subunit SecE